jgi:hypothetical protein
LTADGVKSSAALSRAVANLLRLASSDLKDAEILASGRNPENALLLIHIAVRRMIEAIMATERGWPVDALAIEVNKIPDQNPAKLLLARVSKLALRPNPVALLPDGSVPKAFDIEAFRRETLAVRKIVFDLAGRFDVDLLGAGPAKQATAIRPVPKANPPKVIGEPREIASSARSEVKKQPKAAQSRPSPNQSRRPVPVFDTKAPPTSAASGEENRRSPVLVSPARRSITSAAFWKLIDRWDVPDLDALDLIGRRGGLSKKGTRPRFKLNDEEEERVKLLFGIDQAISSLRLDPKNWMIKPIKAAPFEGAKPISYLTKYGTKGVIATSRYLLKNGLQLSMSSTF